MRTPASMRTFAGWGRTARAASCPWHAEAPEDAADALRARHGRSVLARGAGRSYGDVALNHGGIALLTERLDRIRSFDRESGRTVCEPGVSFAQLDARLLREGFAPPVAPGTGFVTIGGAVANDVHGKNHDRHGSFGNHVEWIELLLPSREIVRIGPETRSDLFRATVGGIGLTGIVLAVCFKAQPVASNAVELCEERIGDLDRFFERFEDVRERATYSVGWIDALARGRRLGRGILETAEVSASGLAARPRTALRVPFDCPGAVLNGVSIGLFNAAYFRRIPRHGRERRVLRERFLYPLDAILAWNRIYGRQGFYQFQCVLPDRDARSGMQALLEHISASRRASFLAVLKTLGREGLGYLSFPMRGYTLALDFPCRAGTRALMSELENITLAHGGRVYLAKDACLSAAALERMYPRLDAFRHVLDAVDPHQTLCSDMARRLGLRADASTHG